MAMENTKVGRTNRRTWMVRVGAALGATPLLLALREYLQPAERVHTVTVDLGAINTVLPTNTPVVVRAAGRNVLLQPRDEGILAFDLTCTHARCPLSFDAAASKIRCACHGGVFAMDGKPLQAPPTTPLRTLETSVFNGNLFVRIPAEDTQL